MVEKNKEYLSWENFETAMKNIKNWAENKKFRNIYGIPRGGLILAVYLSHLLDLPILIDKNKITSETLVVDDICDSGVTLKKYKNYKTATLYYRQNEVFKPDYFVLDAKLNWIVFPWETDKTSKRDYEENLK